MSGRPAYRDSPALYVVAQVRPSSGSTADGSRHRDSGDDEQDEADELHARGDEGDSGDGEEQRAHWKDPFHAAPLPAGRQVEAVAGKRLDELAFLGRSRATNTCGSR